MDTLLWYWEITWDYVAQMLPCAMIAGAMFFALRPWRKRRLAQMGLVSGPWREGGLLLFALFCAGLAALTVFPAYFWTMGHWSAALAGQEPFFALVSPSQSMSHIQWMPTLFQGASTGSWGTYMILANALIFLPIGFFPNLLWRGSRWWKGLLTGFCASLSVEFLQLFVGRATDIDDLILNTLGAFLGGLLCLLLVKLAPHLTKRFQVEEIHGRETGDRAPAP